MAQVAERIKTNAPSLELDKSGKFKPEKRHLILVLIDQNNSSMYYGEDDHPETVVNISCPSTHKMMSRSAIMVRDKKSGHDVVKFTRYIKGCPLILEEEQELAGFKPNPLIDTIFALKGIVTALEGGSDPGLFNYLKYGYNGNVDLEPLVGTRLENSPNEYGQLQEAKDASLNIDEREIFTKADNFLLALRKRDNNGIDWVYKEETIGWLCSLFGLPLFASGNKQEALSALFAKKDENPKGFMEKVSDSKSLIESDFAKGLELGIISLDETGALTFIKTQKILGRFESPTRLGKVEEAIEYFSTHPLQYSSLRTGVSTAAFEKDAIVK